MVDEAQRQRTTFPNEVDALAKQQYDWNRANTEFSRFHAKSDPTAQMYEQAAYEQRGNPGFFNARSPRVFENTQWSPNYPGPKFDTRFIVGSSGGLESLNRGEYYDRMKGSEQNWMDVLKEDVRQRLAGTEVAKSWKRKFQEGLVDPWLEPLLEGLGVNLQPDPEDLITVDELPVTPLEGSIMPEDETEDLLDEYEIEDLLDEDEGYFWEPFGGTQVAGTTEDKWGQLVRDGVVNPGDSLNPLQIDQLYNQHYEGGAGDMDQFGVT